MRAIPPLTNATQQPRSRLFWAALGALAVAQLFAFWLLCSQQVRKAEARDTTLSVQQMAPADCLQYVPGSTVASCSQRMDVMRASAQPDDAAVAGAMPVNFNYR
ncbi:hypothetical protein HK414_05280 [Ramlibacter terrae]|uniref:Uncharacterized protein n=1 Tax=Ramlibacter terrae TaxID=2732511 RepID=A0ABX6P0T7_9BURK|nr:hypothetical protein HK414_05280 [Ramlibacter terrae]